MAKRRIHIDLIVDSEATADIIISRVNIELLNNKYNFFVKDVDVTKNKLDPPISDGRWHVLAQFRFNVDLNADDLKVFVQDMWNEPLLTTKILSGSRVSIHTCPHEENEKQWHPCVEDVIMVK